PRGGPDRQRGGRPLHPAGAAADPHRNRDRPRARDHEEGRRMTATKAERHSAILALVNRGSVHTQQEIATALARRGLRTTQDTIIAVLRKRGAARQLKELLAYAG